MPISYQERRKRWVRLAEEFPPALREHISLRNVEAAASLSSDAQSTLAEALDAGLKQIPAAIRLLKQRPNLSAEGLLRSLKRPKVTSEKVEQTSPILNLPAQPTRPHDERNLAELADLFLTSLVSNTIAAQSLAGNEQFAPLLNLVRARHELFESPIFSSETTIVVLCNFTLRLTAQLEQLIADRPPYRQALLQSKVKWFEPHKRQS